MHCLQNWAVDFKNLHEVNLSRFNEAFNFFSHFPKEGLGDDSADNLSRINEYLPRILKYASDNLSAFLGTLRAYQRMEYPVCHL
jgi:hypothetical protein